jgi:exodeoxyribonuclease-3
MFSFDISHLIDACMNDGARPERTGYVMIYCIQVVEESFMRDLITVASFNVNGIRARLPLLLNWLRVVEPRVLCLQETKVQNEDFPKEPFEKLGYDCAISGQKGFNGVATLSREPLEFMSVGLNDGGPRDEARSILTRVLGIIILNTYVPQGTAPDTDRFQYKLSWFRRLRKTMDRDFDPEERIIWLGDFNVAPEPRDVYDPESLQGEIGFHPEEHCALAEVKEWGWIDVFRKHLQDDKNYTFWDYRIPNALRRGLGLRVDHIWATELMAAKSTRAWIDLEPRRAERPSDHTPILSEFRLD